MRPAWGAPARDCAVGRTPVTPKPARSRQSPIAARRRVTYSSSAATRWWRRNARRAGRRPPAQRRPVSPAWSSTGPGAHAMAALAVCANYLPVARAARLVAAFTAVNGPAGFVAGVRGKAASRLDPFMDRVRALLRQARVLYADETPARADGRLRHGHVACTEFLTALHTGGRSAKAIDAGEVLPGYAGTIVRDGYAGYDHFGDALHAWCGAHGLRDLAGLYRFDPEGQVWARSMADLLIWANKIATAARAAGQASLSEDQLAEIRSWYRGAVAKGITGNQHKRSNTAKDG